MSAHKFFDHPFLLVWFGSLILFIFFHFSEILLEPSTNKTPKVKSIAADEAFKSENN